MSTAAKPTIELAATLVTDVGVVRDHNEDNGYVDADHRYFIVADGMGGHAAGEVASQMAVEEVSKALGAATEQLDDFASAPNDEDRRKIVAVLENAVRAAHQAVFSRGVKESDKQGMGTTLDVLLVTGAEAFIAHVGDSRTYLLRDGKAAQITTDHTVAEVLVIEGKLSIEEAQASPLRTILVNAIGVSADVGVEISHVKLRKADRILLCSDGLHDYFPSEEEIADFLLEGDINGKLQEMVDLAKQRGGHDNITGVVVDVLECAPPDAVQPVEPATSNGVPREIGVVDTMPVDLDDAPRDIKATVPSGVTAIGEDDGGLGFEEGTLPGGFTKEELESSTQRTIPQGTAAIGSAPPAAEAVPTEEPIRKTEPMQTVVPEGMAGEDTVDVEPDKAGGDDESDGSAA